MNENPGIESPGVRIPRQVTAQAEHARSLLKSETEAPAPSPAPAPGAPAPIQFTYEELLRAPTPEKEVSIDYWRARANVSEGFRKRDNDNNRRRIERLEIEVESLKARNLELTQAKAPVPTPAPPPQVDLRKAMQERFSADEIESFGEERALAMTRELMKAGASAEAALAELRGRLDALLEQQQSKVKSEETRQKEEAQARHQKFLDELTALFPEWAKTNQDPRWLDWLDGVDDHTGQVRQEILNNLQGRKDAKSVARMLEAFVKSLGPVTMPPTPPEVPSRVDGTGGDNPPDAKLGTDQPPLTPDEIRIGYKNKALGKMTPEQAALFDARVEATMKAKGRA